MESQRDVDGVNIWPSLSNGKAVRSHTLVNMALYGATNDVSVPDLIQDALSREEKLIHIFSDTNFNFLHSNGHFVYRWFSWKLILGSVGLEEYSASKRMLDNTNGTEDEWTYVKISSIITRVQLYNLHTDPSESDNVALDNPSVVQMVATKMLDYVDRVKHIGQRSYSIRGKSNGVWMPWIENETEGQNTIVDLLV